MLFTASEKDIKQAALILKNGGIVAIPTETVYGLAANALDENAVNKIFKAKGRPNDNPLIVHISKIEDMDKYAYTNTKAYELADKLWPGPLTMILPKKRIIPSIVSGGLDTVALRLPSHEIARKIIEYSGVPLAAPSANISGRPSPTKAEHVISDFGNSIDGVVDGGCCKFGVESTVISLCGQRPVLLRPGFTTFEQLKELLPDIYVSEAVLNILPEDAPVLSPGLKHKHYAPKAEAVCVAGLEEKSANYINSLYDRQKRQAVMCFNGEEKFYSRFNVKSYGSPENAETLAKNLFSVLREFDNENVDIIYIRTLLTEGVGLAVYNRLLRACNFNVINVGDTDDTFQLI